MGFSVSGATAIILIGGLIAFSFAFSAVNNGYERVSEAQQEQSDRQLLQTNSDVGIANVSYDEIGSELTVRVNNTGSAVLTIEELSLLVDGDYQGNVTTSVDGDAETALLLPGEQLVLTVDRASQPDRVKVVAGTGVAATETGVTASA
ncbi:hypothetical protein GCM10028857_02640 [Salinarchaeum chitinilyticum]